MEARALLQAREGRLPESPAGTRERLQGQVSENSPHDVKSRR